MPSDAFQRPLRSLRISVTDRCNLRCSYCMPEENYVWLPRSDILSFEETARLVDALVGLGVDEVRITGGEPLLRQDLDVLVRLLAARPGLRDVSLTTNGVLLPQHAEPLRAAGLRRVTVSLDTLQRERFRRLTRRDDLERVLAGIDAALAAGFDRVKLNTVVLGGSNDDEVADILQFARARGLEVRFIEYMDVGGATQWAHHAVVPAPAILAAIETRFGRVQPDRDPRGSAPAQRYVLDDGTVFGVIASTTQPFCGACDRARLTADGSLFTCLYARAGVDLRALLRGGASDAELTARIADAWHRRTDRGAEERLRLAAERRPFADVGELRRTPHLEMHTRGG
ncbi:MAG: GTP 3',8-cyclase MoaA [Planctomycetota bacterium]